MTEQSDLITAGSYRFVIERDREDDAGAWLVDFPEVPGCHTFGRSLREARERVRDVLSLFADDADTAELVEEMRLPPDVAEALDRAADLRTQAEDTSTAARAATADAARRLTELGMTYRDAADMLGVSYQRIGQLVTKARAAG